MKQLATILFILIFLNAGAQKKWYSITKNDLTTMSFEAVAGYGQGWREEVLYHPNALFTHFPNLNRRFWDSRESWKNGNIKDANHLLKAGITLSHLAAVAFKIGNYKEYKKQRFLKILADIAKNYAAYQIAFFLSYNITHHNKL